MDEELKKALFFHKTNQLEKAKKLYLDILTKKPNDAGIIQLLGVLYLQEENFDLSRNYLEKSFKLDPANPATINNLGNLEKKQKNYIKAKEYFQLNIDKNNFLASWINTSNIFLEQQNYNEGLKFTKLALEKYPDDKKLRNNYAVFLFNCGHTKESLEIYKDFTENKTHFNESLINFSKILLQLKSYNEALRIINILLFANDKSTEGLVQRFLIYKNLKNFEKAEEDIVNAHSSDEDNIYTLKILVDFFVDIKKFNKAINYCNKMIDSNREIKFFLARKIGCKVHLGEWKNLNDDLKLFYATKNDELVFNPLIFKYFNDDASVQKKITENYWSQKLNNKYLSEKKNNYSENKTKNKIRIGYFSGDFRDHPVFHSIQDLFVNHDKAKFEIYCYSSFKKDGPERNKIINNADYFFDIDEKSDEQILNLIKSHSLDIAVDLSGYTSNSKSELFEFEIAKIKINFLGYPGTMGSSKYDYILVDEIVIPEQDKKFYFEKPLYLKENCMPYSPMSLETNFDRTIYKLPKDIFILGCLSRIEKILPNIFNIWMKTLKKFPDVHFALNIRDKKIQNNIREYCEENNFDFNRLIYLDYVESHNDFLKRISTFDLYLDTFPYNGHTITTEVLFKACTPLISFNGKSFASRVSMSLLSSINLDHMISRNEKEYQDKIDYFCSNRDELKKIRQHLLNYKNKNLDRMKVFTQDFENLMLRSLEKNNLKKIIK